MDRTLLALLLAVLVTAVQAKTLVIAAVGNVSVSLTDEPCQIKAVSNLPYRATWVEGAQTFEGCYGIFGQSMVAAYFSDGSVVVIPVRQFVIATSI